jgi:hypothetical protein
MLHHHRNKDKGWTPFVVQTQGTTYGINQGTRIIGRGHAFGKVKLGSIGMEVNIA